MFRHSYVIFSCKCSTGVHLNFNCIHDYVIVRRVSKRSPILIKGRKRNSWIAFIMVIMASGIDRGRVLTTAMTAILQLIGWQRHVDLVDTVVLSDIGHPCYGQLTPVKTRYPLISITWPYRGLKFRAYRGHFYVDRCWFSIGSCTNVFHCLCFVNFEIFEAQNGRPDNMQKTPLERYETQIKILAFPGLV